MNETAISRPTSMIVTKIGLRMIPKNLSSSVVLVTRANLFSALLITRSARTATMRNDAITMIEFTGPDEERLKVSTKFSIKYYKSSIKLIARKQL